MSTPLRREPLASPVPRHGVSAGARGAPPVRRRGHRLLLAVLGLVLWIGAIVARLGYLQVAAHEDFKRRAERQQQRVITVDAPRGTIFDARGRELAVSVAVRSAYAVPKEIRDPRATAAALAPLLAEPARTIEGRLAGSREFAWVARKLDRPVAERVAALGLPGIYFLEESKRYYPMRELAAHVLGYVGTDNVGLAGLELAYEREVAGTSVRRTVLRDARRGTALDPSLSFASTARPGADLHLTLDATIQHIVERELARTIATHHAKRGSVVVLDPADGALLALASWPSFDPNRFGEHEEATWRNRAIQDAYEPGSTFKIITAAAALEHNLVDPADTFDCEMGAITLLGTRIGDHKPFGVLDFRQILAKSSNVGAIKLGLVVGAPRLHAMISAFGFGATTGVDLPGEHAGIVRPLERWQPLSKAYISFGQEISITPLQLAVATAAIANGGELVRPYVVAASDAPGAVRPVANRATRPPARRPISPTTARALERMLEAVVSDGTAKTAAIPGYPVAGKTGTAQKAEPGRGYSATRFVASFVGFAPARNPRLLVAVVIDEPWPLYHGGDVAAPAFARIAGETLLYLGHRPERARPERWPREPLATTEATATVLASLRSTPSPDDAEAEGDGVALVPATAEATVAALPPVAAPADGRPTGSSGVRR